MSVQHIQSWEKGSRLWNVFPRPPLERSTKTAPIRNGARKKIEKDEDEGPHRSPGTFLPPWRQRLDPITLTFDLRLRVDPRSRTPARLDWIRSRLPWRDVRGLMALALLAFGDLMVNFTHTMRGTGGREPHPCAVPSCSVRAAVIGLRARRCRTQRQEGSRGRRRDQQPISGFLQPRRGQRGKDLM